MKIVRYCEVCDKVLGKLRKATHVASGTDFRGDYISWNECLFHTEFQNHLNIKRTEIETFEVWFLDHGFDFDKGSLQAVFPATTKCVKRKSNTYRISNGVIEDMLSKWGGIRK